jgi:hypothetical protein
MIYPKSKAEIVETVLKEIGDDPDSPWKGRSIDKLMFDWWSAGRSGTGLRLSESGKDAFEYAKIARYDLPFGMHKNNIGTTSGWVIFIREVDRKINCPYYLGTEIVDNKNKPFIRVYDHKIAVLMTLYGNLSEYLNSIK